MHHQPDSTIMPSQALLNILDGMWIARAVHSAAQLGLADLLGDDRHSVQELADKTASHTPSLYRLLRALGSVAIFQEVEPTIFANTEHSTYLRSDRPDSLYAVALQQGADWNWRTWAGLAYSVQTGQPAFDLFHTMTLWHYRAENPAVQRIHSSARASLSETINEPLAQAYDFSSVHTLMEIAGGPATFLTTVLQRYPSLQAILVDAPGEITQVRTRLTRAGLTPRCLLCTEDPFEHVPEGADAILLKQVLRNYSDDACVHLLRSCRRVSPPLGKLLIVEYVVPGPPIQASSSLFADLELLVETAGGCERTEAEYQKLLERAGWLLNRTLPMASTQSILEAVLQ